LNRNILGLAPLAVLPALQHRGIGSVLIRASFEICLNQAVDGAVVLGSHDYYPRFGFSPAGNYGMECEYPVPPQDFMVISFHPGGVEGCSGMVHYHPLFAGLGI
jgi:putative acetyltransferase